LKFFFLFLFFLFLIKKKKKKKKKKKNKIKRKHKTITIKNNNRKSIHPEIRKSKYNIYYLLIKKQFKVNKNTNFKLKI